MPKFPVPSFGRRKSTAEGLENAPPVPSFRVLDRSEVAPPGGGKSFDGGARLNVKTHTLPKTRGSNIVAEDNIFADLKSNRSSNTTKTASTDNSSRHSNASTTPSSADLASQEEWRITQRKTLSDIPVPPIPKSSPNGFLRAAGRTFSFGGQKKHHLPAMSTTEEDGQNSPTPSDNSRNPKYGRSRATTSSTSTTMTPPRVEDDFDLDLGGDFGKLLLGANDKRASVLTVKDDENGRQPLGTRTLTGSRFNQTSPVQADSANKVEAPHSWSSRHSNDQHLATSNSAFSSPRNENASPPVPRHSSPLVERTQRPSASPEASSRKPLLAAQSSSHEQREVDDEEARLLRDSLSTVTRFMSGKSAGPASNTHATSRYRRNEDSFNDDDDSLFDTSHTYSPRSAQRFAARKPTSPPQSHKVMTPAEFERYRKDKERQDKERQLDTYSSKAKVDDDDDDNYEEDDDDIERAKQQAKQRRKQEAHMSVYRQQMMKVTGEAANGPPSRPSLQFSFSTPNLPEFTTTPSPGPGAKDEENSDEDEEVPLAYLAAHGFPNKNRPPARLSTMMSNPNLRASQQPSYQRPGSVVGDGVKAVNPRLPAFARNLPQDPFIGAGLVRTPIRESLAFGGGSMQPGGPVPPGGLVGVIASEERSRALRRGSPHIDAHNPVPGAVGYDPVGGIPPHMMYQNQAGPPQLAPGDPAQFQMTQQMQQMQQFMQMQMQLMQMMAQNGNLPQGPHGNMAAQSMGNLSAMNGMPGMPPTLGVPGFHGMGGPEGGLRHSYMGNDSMLDLPPARGDAQMRTMSMVQPSSASWIQLPQNPGFAPSIRIQGYAPSIAPSERSNVGLPGRYRPVSHVPPPMPTIPGHLRQVSAMSGSLQPNIQTSKSASASDDDDEEGWEAMKAKREKKKTGWRSKKSLGDELGAFIR